MDLMLKAEEYSYKKLSEKEFARLEASLTPVKLPLEQSPVWGAFNNHVSGREFLGSFSYSDTSGKLIALASATLYHERGRDWIWIKHGPVFADAPTSTVIKTMCQTLAGQFASTGAVFIRLSLPNRVSPLILPFEHTMYDETVVVELTKSEDELFMGMSQSGRQGVRKALKFGISVHEITKNREEAFTNLCYPVLEETGERDKFGIHPLSVYTAMLKHLPDHARLYTAQNGKEVQAWAITTEYNGQAMYYYGASSHAARGSSAAYLLHWEIIKLLKARNNETYDLMGIAGKHYPALKNVTQFKIKFSKNIVTLPLAYDLPLQKAKYHALALALKTKRRLAR